jgi:hypothetical protein
MLLVPLLLLGVVMAFAFAGCKPFDAADTPPEAHPAPQPDPNPHPPDPNPHPHPTPAPPNLAYANDVLAESASLRGYWRLNEQTGATVAADSSTANPRPLNYHGTPTFGVKGPLQFGGDTTDTSVAVDGASSFAEHDFDVLLNPPGAFTIEAWVKPDALAAGSVGVVVGSYTGLTHLGFALDIVPGGATGLQARARVGDRRRYNTVTADLGDTAVHGGWHYLVATYGKDTPADQNHLRLYVDGGTAQELSGVNYQPAQPLAVSPPFRVGAGTDEGSATQATPANFFKGGIDDVALYDKVLDATTVNKHFHDALTPP